MLNDNDKSQAYGQIKNLIFVANADGTIRQAELDKIAEVAEREGLTQEELDNIIDNIDNISIDIPADEKTKWQYLTDMVELMMSDKDLDDMEISLCELYAMNLGYQAKVVAEIVAEILSNKHHDE